MEINARKPLLRFAPAKAGFALAGLLPLLVTGQVQGFGTPLPTDVNIIPSATSISAPTLMLHGTSDGIVVPTRTTTLASAMRSAKRDVTVHWYTTECEGGCNHDLLAHTRSRNDVIERASAWLHRQLS